MLFVLEIGSTYLHSTIKASLLKELRFIPGVVNTVQTGENRLDDHIQFETIVKQFTVQFCWSLCFQVFEEETQI